MCSSSTRLSAILRTPWKPTSVTARDTVLIGPPRAYIGVFTSRSSLCVSATSLRISLVSDATLSRSELEILWMRAIVPDMASARIWLSAAEPMKMPAALTDTERAPPPESNWRQPPESLLVMVTAWPATDIWVVRRPATV